MRFRNLKKSLSFLLRTPFHPQWLIGHNKYKFLLESGKKIEGRVLDIGCYDKSSRQYLDRNVEYIGLDYLTADTLYDSRPDIYGNAENLPFLDGSINTVLLLDVLEHVQHPVLCIEEIHRIMRTGGLLVINIPFIYPLHDVPHDYHRWTLYGIRSLLTEKGFHIQTEKSYGKAIVTACLMANLALSKSVLNSIERRHPGILLILLLPVLIPVINLTGYLSRLLFPADDFMPYRYHLIAVKSST